jgi:hypothetical protein
MKRYLNLNGDININEHSSDEEYCCNEMQKAMINGSFSFGYKKQLAETYLVSREGASNFWGVDFCPFCGKNIHSKSEIFYKCISDELGISTEDAIFDYDTLDEHLPPEFHTDEWWKKRGL